MFQLQLPHEETRLWSFQINVTSDDYNTKKWKYFRTTCVLKNYICFAGYGDRKSGTEMVTTLKERNSGLFLLISVPEQIYTYLGVSHLNSYGSPQTPKSPFH